MTNQSKAKTKPNKPTPKSKRQTSFPFALICIIYFIAKLNVENVVAVVLPRAPLLPQEGGRCTLVEWREFYLFCIFYCLFL